MPPRLHYYLRFLFGLSRWEMYGMWTLLIVLVIGVPIMWWEKEEEPIYLESYLEELERRFQQEMASKSRAMRQQQIKGLGKVKWKRPYLARGPNKVKFLGVIDINTADSVAWMALPGIGPSLAHRIVAFREKLGGFYAVEQMAEVYGLDSVWVKANRANLKLGKGIFRKLRINQLEWNLLRHPYLSYSQAKIFFRYKKQHGSVKNWEQLKEIIPLDEKLWVKLRPYLDFE